MYAIVFQHFRTNNVSSLPFKNSDFVKMIKINQNNCQKIRNIIVIQMECAMQRKKKYFWNFHTRSRQMLLRIVSILVVTRQKSSSYVDGDTIQQIKANCFNTYKLHVSIKIVGPSILLKKSLDQLEYYKNNRVHIFIQPLVYICLSHFYLYIIFRPPVITGGLSILYWSIKSFC